MVHDPLPHQLSVGRLRELLRDVPDSTIVALSVPAGLRVDPRFRLFFNLAVDYAGGPVLNLTPVEMDPEERPAS